MTSIPSAPGSGSEEGWSSPLDSLLGAGFASPDQPAGAAPIHPADPQFGTPQTDVQVWAGQQGYPDTCAIRCQEFVLEQFTGTLFDEAALVQEATSAGWYTPGGGTSLSDLGNLLESHGIAVSRYEGATVFHLANELAQGHKVIVGVDSGELWGQHPILEALEDRFGIAGADHAVVVSGIDTTDPDQVQVVVSDPGTGEAAAIYPLDQFVDAWRDSDFFMVTTQDPAPPSVPEMVNFDYGLGHIPAVWGLLYDQFFALGDRPDAWDQALGDALGLADADPANSLHSGGPRSEVNGLAWHDDPVGPDQDLAAGLDHHDHFDPGDLAGWRS